MNLPSGRFYRIATVDAVADVLKGAASMHGRYHSEPRTAIYMSAVEAWAWTALKVHMRDGDPPRVSVPLDMSEANVLDLRDPSECSESGIDPADAVSPWKAAIEGGQRPRSWDVAEQVARLGFDGLIDKSRRIPDGWHLVLFRWNHRGGPTVAIGEGFVTG